MKRLLVALSFALTGAIAFAQSYPIITPGGNTNLYNNGGMVTFGPGNPSPIFNNIQDVYTPYITGVSAADTAAILASALQAKNSNGGIVLLPSTTITLTQSLPMYNGVVYEGTYWQNTFSQNTTPTGTVLTGNGTFDCFSAKTTPLGADDGAAAFISGAGVVNIAMSNCLNGIHVGATNSRGLFLSRLQHLYISGCTGWGLYLENTEQVYAEDIAIEGCANGIAWGASDSTWNGGDSVLEKVGTTETGGNSGTLSRHIYFYARANSVLNGMQMGNSYALGTYTQKLGAATGPVANGSYSGTLTASSATITMASTANLAVGFPMVITTAANPGGFVTNKTYFIQSLVANTSITLAPYDFTDITTGVNSTTNNAAIVNNTGSSIAITLKTKGFAGFAAETVYYNAGAGVTGLHIYNSNTENAGTGQFFFQGTTASAINYGEPNANDGVWGSQALYAFLGRSNTAMEVNFLPYGNLNDADGNYLSNSSFQPLESNSYNFNSNSGIGIHQLSTGSGYGCITLQGQTVTSSNGCDIYFENTNNLFHFNNQSWTFPVFNLGSGNTWGTYMGNNINFATTGGGTFTLPVCIAGLNGLFINLSNPQSGAVTVNQTGSVAGFYGVIPGGTLNNATSVTQPAYANYGYTCMTGTVNGASNTSYWAVRP